MNNMLETLEKIKTQYYHWNQKRSTDTNLTTNCTGGSDCSDIGSDCHGDGECGGDGE